MNENIKQETINELFLTGPGEDLVPKTLMQLAKVPGFVKLFGPYTPKSDNQRWADYCRFDWSTRVLPVINVFEAENENKDSDQAFLRGTLQIQTFWPPNFRRSDSRRVEVAYKGAMQNFFSSIYVKNMLDELCYILRPEKVNGLNEFGKTITWAPNTEGLIGEELCPVTILNINYRIDLRAWYRTLEFQGRTKEQPFEETLDDLAIIGGIDNNITSTYQGIDEAGIWTEVPDEIQVYNP
jgi:hypothetical protein